MRRTLPVRQDSHEGPGVARVLECQGLTQRQARGTGSSPSWAAGHLLPLRLPLGFIDDIKHFFLV